MSAGRFFDGNKELRLGASIGRGGEGEVFALADGSGRAVKIYADPDSAREAKIRAMVAAGLHCNHRSIAFPLAVVTDERGRFAGFIMQTVKGEPIHQLYSPSSRRQLFPQADWRFLVQVARNVAQIFDELHRAGIVVGDINGSGMLVAADASVTFIDADSFQTSKRHLCRVGVPEFTPPELSGRSLSGVVRKSNHDAFGLAVLIFLLLFLGRHPAAGVPYGRVVIALPTAVARGCFAYSLIRRMPLRPPPGTLRLSDLPAGVRACFERAFAIGIGPRPTARQWFDELAHLERQLTPCPSNGSHTLPRLIAPCPWCRIEKVTKRDVFGKATSSTGRMDDWHSVPAVHEAHTAITRAERMLADPQPPRNWGLAEPSSAAKACKANFAAGVHDLPRLLLSQYSAQGFELRYREAEIAWKKRAQEWMAQNGADQLCLAAQGLRDELTRYHQIATQSRAHLAGYEARLRADEVKRALAATPLLSARIHAVGRRRLAMIAATDLVNAAQISRGRLAIIRGVGERTITALILWRDELAVSTGRTLQTSPQKVAATKADAKRTYAAQLDAMRIGVTDLTRKLQQMVDDMKAKARRPNVALQRAAAALRQADADRRYVDGCVRAS